MTVLTMSQSYVLRDAEGRFFCLPHGIDFSEWSEHPHMAHRWSDRQACLSAAFCFQKFRGLALQVSTCTEPLVSG